MELNLVSLEEQDGWYEYDFFPGRKFDGVSHILLYKRESFGNMEYYWYFRECESKNIQVIVYTTLNLFPIASLCSHKCRMAKTDVSSFYVPYNSNTIYHFPTRKAFAYFNVPKWDISNPLREVIITGKVWEIGWAVDLCFRRSLHMDVTAYERFQNAKEVYHEGLICVETMFGPSDKTGKALRQLGPHVVGSDYEFQRNVITTYHGQDCYLSFQILASLFCKTAFVGISGAGSLLTLALPVNTILAIDHEFNLPESHRLYKSRLNYALFHVPTHGFPFYITRYGFNHLSTGWRWAMIEEAFSSVSDIQLPKVQIHGT